MKKVTILAIIVSLIYCGLSIYAFTNISLMSPKTLSVWDSSLFVPGYFLGFIGLLFGGIPFAIIGHVITFLFLLYLLKTTFNWIANEFKN